MANAEHLEILKSGVENWNEWRKENRKIHPDLSNDDLSNIKLSQANLSNADLAETDLSNANLSNADLFNADLSYTNLSSAKLTNARLMYANLIEAELPNADLLNADLTDANLTFTNLDNVNFKGCLLSRTIFGLTNLSTCLGLDTVRVNFPSIIDFQTLRTSKNLPKSFLLKIGLPELFIDYLPEFYGDTLNFYPVFLSHSWENKHFARKLYEALIAKGVNVFFDEKKMKPGDDIYESISKGITWYDKMILVCSKESLLESWWVDRELDRILKKERDLFKERGHRINLLIPIAIDDHIFKWDGAKAEEVRRYVIGDFKDWQDDAKFEKALNDLVHALNADRPDVKPKSLL